MFVEANLGNESRGAGSLDGRSNVSETSPPKFPETTLPFVEASPYAKVNRPVNFWSPPVVGVVRRRRHRPPSIPAMCPIPAMWKA
jgi:hypothetical protein